MSGIRIPLVQLNASFPVQKRGVSGGDDAALGGDGRSWSGEPASPCGNRLPLSGSAPPLSGSAPNPYRFRPRWYQVAASRSKPIRFRAKMPHFRTTAPIRGTTTMAFRTGIQSHCPASAGSVQGWPISGQEWVILVRCCPVSVPSPPPLAREFSYLCPQTVIPNYIYIR